MDSIGGARGEPRRARAPGSTSDSCPSGSACTPRPPSFRPPRSAARCIATLPPPCAAHPLVARAGREKFLQIADPGNTSSAAPAIPTPARCPKNSARRSSGPITYPTPISAGLTVGAATVEIAPVCRTFCAPLRPQPDDTLPDLPDPHDEILVHRVELQFAQRLDQRAEPDAPEQIARRIGAALPGLVNLRRRHRFGEGKRRDPPPARAAPAIRTARPAPRRPSSARSISNRRARDRRTSRSPT